MCQSLRPDFSIIENVEWMQTINNKRNYKIQQLFKMLPLVWTHAWSRFLHWCGPCQWWSVGSQPQTLTTSGFSSGRVLASCICAPAWCCCCHGNHAVGTQPISSFSNAVNSQLNADASSEKNIHNGPILMKLYQPVLGVRFFWNTVYVWIVVLDIRPIVVICNCFIVIIQPSAAIENKPTYVIYWQKCKWRYALIPFKGQRCQLITLCHPSLTYIFNSWHGHSGARMSDIKNVG